MSFGSDGAATLRGKNNGVAKKIQDSLDHGVNTNKILRIVPFHKIRWMSRVNTIKRIIRLIQPLLLHYENLSASENHPRYKHLTNYALLKFLYVVADILEPLSVITKMWQSNSVTIVKMSKILIQQKQILLDLKITAGKFGRIFERSIEITNEVSTGIWLRSDGVERPNVVKFYNHKLHFTPNMNTMIATAKVKFIEDLNERFEGFDSTLQSLDIIFDLLEDSVDDEKLNTLATLYGVDAINLEEEIAFLKGYMKTLEKKNIKFNNFKEFAEYVLTKISKNEIPLLHYFISLVLVLPFSSADCERAFSAMNLIKSKSRNRLKDILRSLMVIYTATREDLDSLDRKKMAEKVARSIWKNKRATFSQRYLEQLI